MSAFIALGLRVLLLLLAYAFVGWIGVLIYRDFINSCSGRKALDIPALRVSAQINQKISTKEFQIPEIIIGRDPASDFPLLDEAISLQHCKLFFKQNHWWIEDLKSTNGTFVNQDPIDAPVILVGDDEIRLGRIYIEVDIHEKVRRKS